MGFGEKIKLGILQYIKWNLIVALIMLFFGALYLMKFFFDIYYYSAQSYNSRGWSKYESKDYSGAIEDYDKAIELDSNYVTAYTKRGTAKWYLKDKKGACEDWKIAAGMGSTPSQNNLRDYCN